MGYHRAGFDVFGVDLRRNLQNPFPYFVGDALAYLDSHGQEFDAVHASPPCQAHSILKNRHRDDFDSMLFPMTAHPDLVPATRAALIAAGLPYIIENVPGAPLLDPVILCGSMFGLGAVCEDGWRQLKRHRLFESNVPLIPPGPCVHVGDTVGVYGNGGGGLRAATRGYKATQQEGNAALGTGWMSVYGMSQAIPPAYTEWLGAQLLDHLAGKAPGAVVLSPVGPARGGDGLLGGPSDHSRDRHYPVPYIDETPDIACYHAAGE